MKSKLFSIALLLILTISYACSKNNKVNPSSTITTREYNVSGFNQLRIEDGFQVNVEISADEELVMVEANDNLFSHIIVDKNQNELLIKLDDKLKMEGNEPTLNVYITTDHIFAFRASGASYIKLEDSLNANLFEVNLSGASFFDGPLVGEEVNVALEGASGVMLIGSSTKLNINGTGASTVEGFDFSTNWLHADLSGASTVSTTVNNKLDVWASGASTVYYKGDGVINTQQLSGGSKIVKVDK